MATLEKSIEIIFGATDRNVGKTTQSIADSLNGLEKNISNVTEPLSEVAKQALAAETALLAMGTALAGVAVDKASEFNNAVGEIGTLTNASAEQVAAMKDEIIAFGQVSGFSFEDITGAMYDMISATGDAENALSGLSEAQNLARIGGTDLNSAVDALTTVINSYGLDMSQAADISDTFFVAIQNGKTTLPELQENIGKVASIASAAGVDFQSLSASIAAITASGVNTAESMTLIQNVIKELIDPSTELKTALGGISLEGNGLEGVMKQLKIATGGNFEEMNKLFGSVEATKAAVILANDSSGTFTRTLEAMEDRTGKVSENLKLLEGDLGNLAQVLTNNVDAALIGVGDQIGPEFAKIVEETANLFDSLTFSINDGAFSPLFDAFNNFQREASDLIGGIADALPEALEQVDFTGLAASFGEISDAIGGIFDLDLTDPEQLADAIQFVTDTIESLNLVVAGIIEAWEPAIDIIYQAIEAFNEQEDSTKKIEGNVLGLSQVFETFKGLLSPVTGSIELLGEALNTLAAVQAASTISELGLALTGVDFAGLATKAGALATALGQAGLVAAAGASGYAVGSVLKEGIDGLISTVTGSEQTLGTFIYDLFHAGDDETTSQAVRDVTQSVQDQADTIGNVSTNTLDWQSIVNDFVSNSGLVSDSVADIAQQFATLEEAQNFAQKAFAGSNNVLITYKDGLYSVSEGFDSVSQDLSKSTDNLKDAQDELAKGSAEWKRVQDVLLDTQKVANDFRVDMQALANERYEVQVRAAVDLQTAQIEADTQRIQAAFESINQAVSSLTTGTTDLWSAFSDKAGFVGGDELEEAALRMERRLDQELELKRQLTEAIVEQAYATADRLNSDTPIINIDGAQLQPELEMIFDKILEYTQIRATNEGLNLLLGV